MHLEINPDLDIPALTAAFRQDGRVQLLNWINPDAANALHMELRTRSDWVQVVNSGEKVIELSRAMREGLGHADREALDNAVYAGARYGFQYRYETIRIPDDHDGRQPLNDLLAQFALWLSGGLVRDMLRTITGHDDIAFADAQATAYSPDDFLTGHDDAVTGKGRRAAYVFGLTPIWRVEWGGLLLFHDKNGHLVEGWVPSFNCLNLFAVPQMHSVSPVSRAAAFRRYAITGWLRNETPA